MRLKGFIARTAATWAATPATDEAMGVPAEKPDVDRLLLACAILTVGGLLALGLLVSTVEQESVSMDVLERRAGQRVCVEGTLAHLRTSTSGATRFVVAEANRSLEGTAWFAWAAVPGDAVRACGTLRAASSGFELQPDRSRDLTILRSWDDEVVPLDRLAHEPWSWRDQRVATVGVLESEHGRAYMRDPQGPARLRSSSSPDAPAGTVLRFEGILVFDAEESQFRFLIEDWRAAEPRLP